VSGKEHAADSRHISFQKESLATEGSLAQRHRGNSRGMGGGESGHRRKAMDKERESEILRIRTRKKQKGKNPRLTDCYKRTAIGVSGAFGKGMERGLKRMRLSLHNLQRL